MQPRACPDGLVPGRRPHLTLVHGVVVQGRVAQAEAVHPAGVIARHGVTGEAGELTIVT